MKRAKPVAKLEGPERTLEQLLKDLTLALKLATKLRLNNVKANSWAGLSLISRAESKRLNQTYLKKDYPTDILSFPSDSKFQRIMKGYIGELMICHALAREQARSLGHSELVELRVLMVHGILHLLGYDHEKSKRDTISMRSLEQRLLSGLKWAKLSSGLSSKSERKEEHALSRGKTANQRKGSKRIESLIARSISIKTIK